MKARLLAILCGRAGWSDYEEIVKDIFKDALFPKYITEPLTPVSYTHLRAHET